MPEISQEVIVQTQGIIRPQHVLFIGTPGGELLNYESLYHFARRSIQVVRDNSLPVRRLATPSPTAVHGEGYGLDPIEAFLYILRGFQTELDKSDSPIEEICFVEKHPLRVPLLRKALNEELQRPPEAFIQKPQETEPTVPSLMAVRLQEAANLYQPYPHIAIQPKEHVFVAMLYSETFEDIYNFGVFAPVRECGYICERVDQVAFTGDILQRIRDRIRSAKFVIADLTGARPNVYLEVGFAWGCNKDVILIAQKSEQPHFDVVTHRTIFYNNATHLSQELKKLISEVYGKKI